MAAVKKYITMEPREIRFKNETGDEIDEERGGKLTWKDFLNKVSDHPKWITKYKLSRMMDDIFVAYEEAVERDDWVMVIDDDDTYKELEAVCQEPKYVVIDPVRGPREEQGWGVHPRLNRQMICFPRAVINAVDVDPRKKEEEEPEPNENEEPASEKKSDEKAA